jgi:hypothetical protein
MGTAGGPGATPEVNNVLNALNWKASNVKSTGSETVDLLDGMVANINVQENSGANDRIRLWGVTANGQVNLSQSNGSSDSISIDQLVSTNPPGGGNPILISSVLGLVKLTQGSGRADNLTINHTQVRIALSAEQGDGASDGLFLGSGDTVGSTTVLDSSPATTVWNGPLLIGQGSAENDYIGVDNLSAGIVTLLQRDLATNSAGDRIGGVTTPSSPGLDAPSTTTAEVVHTAGPPFSTPLGVAAPTDGFRNALLEQLNITQGSAPGDLTALVQLPGGSTTSESLTITGAPSVLGLSSTPGTLTILQQDVASSSGDFLLMGSYTPDPAFVPTLPGQPGYSLPPYFWTNPVAIGAITAVNYHATQGDALGDTLSVLFVTATSSMLDASSQFAQGNGGDDAFFQRDTAVAGGRFNYVGGSGSNYVQADSNHAAGTFDGGPNVPHNLLGQDNANLSLSFADFGSVIFA